MQPTFSTFVPTRGTRHALAVTLASVAGQEGAPRLVLLHGPPGVGKTHLLRAAAHETARLAGAAPLITTASDMVREIASGRLPRSDGTGGQLVIDDLHTLARLPMCQREVGRAFEEHIRAGGTVLAAAGSALTDLESLVQWLRRIEGAQVCAMMPPRISEMAKLLRVLAARDAIKLERAAASRMAQRCRGDVRLAEGALARTRLLQGRALHWPASPARIRVVS